MPCIDVYGLVIKYIYLMPTANDGLFKRTSGANTKNSGVWDVVKLDNITTKLEDMTANLKALNPLPGKVENLTATLETLTAENEALSPLPAKVENLTATLETLTAENVAKVENLTATLEDLTTKYQTLVEKLANGMYFKHYL